jgi:hypothetical protein
VPIPKNAGSTQPALPSSQTSRMRRRGKSSTAEFSLNEFLAMA